jgi:hypothetical protein
VKGQLPLSAGGLSGQGVEQFGRSEALVSLLNHQLSFPNQLKLLPTGFLEIEVTIEAGGDYKESHFQFKALRGDRMNRLR